MNEATATLRAAMSGLSPEVLSVARAAFRITVRAAPQGSPQRPAPGQRLRDGARIFTILSVTEQDAEGRFLTLWAEEEVVT